MEFKSFARCNLWFGAAFGERCENTLDKNEKIHLHSHKDTP